MERVVFFLHRVYPKKGVDDLSLKDFERALTLISSRFKVVPLEELLSSPPSGKRLAAITFDDGYADNWVYAYPLLKKRGLKAHLFITSGRIRQEEDVRPNLFDYWEGKVSRSELLNPSSMEECHRRFFLEGNKREFLSWEELRRMSDVFTFGAHGLNHGKLPVSSEILDFYDGENFHRDYLFPTPELFIGKPRFKCKSSLYGRAFIPSQELCRLCRSFPKKKGWKEALRGEVERVGKGRFEEREEAERRIEEELQTSNRLIEKNLGVKPETFSWPFGHYSETSQRVASRLYRFVFTTKRGVISDSFDPFELPRVPLGRELWTVLGRVITFSTPLYKLYGKLKREKSL